jgi:DNA polymerase elongation subunit (family B)
MTEFSDAYAAAIAAKKAKRKAAQKAAYDKWRANPNNRAKRNIIHSEYKKNVRANKRAAKKLAVLDFETDPFDFTRPDLEIEPFACDVYSPELGHNVFWASDSVKLIAQITTFLASVEDEHVIYAHNGGKFDWLFFLRHIKGEATFKGRALMKATLCGHEIRDSMHIIPAPLAAVQKDVFDYSKLKRGTREVHKNAIIKYMMNDCEFLYANVQAFRAEHGMAISIGQASITACRKVVKTGRTTDAQDEKMRAYYYGGLVDCIQGYGEFLGDYKLYDVNSMYPAVMAQVKHPLDTEYEVRTKGYPTDDTYFITLECKNERALVGRTEDKKLSTRAKSGVFHTTIHEFNNAIKHGKLSDIKIIKMYDYFNVGTFADFILPIYAERQQLKAHCQANPDDIAAKRRELILKLLMNNCYGKYAQNSRKFKEVYLTEPETYPPDNVGRGEGFWGDIGDGQCEPSVINDAYWMWERPNPGKHFNNVGIAASITGAARAKLIDAIFQASDPVYCDTDSLICKELRGVEIDKTKLGCWGLEASFNEVLIGGKKLYACRQVINGEVIGKPKIRHKGVSHRNGLTWEQMRDIVVNGAAIPKTNFAPTLKRDGSQVYETRTIKRTELCAA